MASKDLRYTNRIKDLYRSKGVLNEGVLRPDILKSWERSKIYSSMYDSFGHLSDHNSELLTSTSETQKVFKGIANEIKSVCGIYLVNKSGEVLQSWSQDEVFRRIVNWSEKHLGTSAYSLFKQNSEFSIVDRWEHYLPIFDDVITVAIPLEMHTENDSDALIGIIRNMEDVAEFENHVKVNIKEISHCYENQLSNSDNSTHKEPRSTAIGMAEYYEFSNYNRHFIAGISREITSFKQKIVSLNSEHNYLRVCAESIDEAMSGVGFLIESTSVLSKNKEREKCEKPLIAIVSPNYFSQHIAFEYSKIPCFDVLIIVSLQRLTYEQQRQIVRSIQTMSVDSDGQRKEGSREKKIYLVDTIQDVFEEKSPLIIEGLKVLQTAPRVILEPLKRRRADIPMVVRELETVLDETRSGEKSGFWSEVSKTPELINWNGTAADLSRWIVFSYFQGQTTKCFELDSHSTNKENDALNTGLEDGVEELRDGERDNIIKALAVYSNNMNKTSKALGIARSTLYRKIESYNITIERKLKSKRSYGSKSLF